MIRTNLPASSVALNTTRTEQNDTVVEYYMSSDGITWYRKWASGWKECGVTATPNGSVNTVLPLSFSNLNYYVVAGSRINGTSTTISISCGARPKTVDTITVYSWWASKGETGYTSGDQPVNIYCCGF